MILEKLDERAALDTLAKLAEGNPAVARTSEAERLDLYRETALRLRGLGRRLANDNASAIVAYRKAVKLFRMLNRESSDTAATLNDLANAERSSGQLDKAERDYTEALRIARAINFDEGVAAYTGNLAVLAIERNNWASAEAYARQSILLSEKIGRLESIGLGCNHLAEALVRQGKNAEALLHAQRAVEIFTRLGSRSLAFAQEILAECNC
ncbi:MAG: hypothetical protein V7638_904 [Acidobacteriota bacterium]